MSNLMTMGSCLSEQQKRWNDNISSAHRIADSYMQYAEQNMADAHELGFTAQMLNNFAEKHGSYDKAMRAFGRIKDDATGADPISQSVPFANTHTNSFGPWIMDVWPLITAWYPEFPLKDLVSVQEMEKPLAWMFFSTLKTGTNKADTVLGEVVETALGMRQLKARYVTGEIVGEAIKPSQLNFDSTSGLTQSLLAYNPINLASDYKEKLLLEITVGGTVTADDDVEGGTVVAYEYAGDSDGVITFKEKGTSTVKEGLTLDINTGLLTYTEESGATERSINKVVANYVWNLDYATTENLPRVKEDVEKVEMVAKERALLLEWTLFAEYLKKTQFGQDIQQNNLRRCLDLMYQYQVRYVLDEMYTYAEGKGDGVNVGSEADITIPASAIYSTDVKVQQVLEALNNTANLIEIASGRMAGNRIVVGRNFKAFLESLPNTYYKAEADNSKAFSSPRKIGEFGGFYVYFDPFMKNNKGFMTYRGSEFYDAAYYIGMYMPLTTTDTVVLGVSAKQSFVSMEAYKFHKKNCVIKLNFRAE